MAVVEDMGLSEGLRVVKKGILSNYKNLEEVVRVFGRIPVNLLQPFQMRVFTEVKKVCYFTLIVVLFLFILTISNNYQYNN